MKLNPLLASQASLQKPPSEVRAGGHAIAFNAIRDSFTITTWLLLGAALQSLPFFFSIRPTYAVAPVAVLLLWRIGDTLAMTFGWKRNIYMDGVVHGKHSAVFPGTDGSFSRPDGKQITPGGGEVTILLLGARSNDPLGRFAPGLKGLGDYISTMIDDLEANPETFGFLGAGSWLNASARTSSSEILTIFYFRSQEHLHKFAHSESHRKGWDWWNRNVKNFDNIGIMHESYTVPAGNWETIYVNYAPTGFARTSHPIVDEKGEKRWVSPIVDASRSRMRTSAGRLGLDNGIGNEKYGAEPYEALV